MGELRSVHYPLAFSTLACPDWSWEQAVQKAVEYGYQGYDGWIAFEWEKRWHPEVLARDHEKLKR